jgi:hypothetical protein
LIISSVYDRKRILERLNKKEVESLFEIISREKNVDKTYENHYAQLFDFIAKNISSVDYNSFDTFNSIFATENPSEVEAKHKEMVNKWDTPSILTLQNSSECFGFAITTSNFFNSIGLKSDILTTNLGNQISNTIPFNHVAVAVEDPILNREYLIDPFNNITQAVDLNSVKEFVSKEGKIFYVNEINTENVALSYKNKAGVIKPLVFNRNNNVEQINNSLKLYIKDKTRPILYVHYNKENKPIWIKYNANSNLFETNILDLEKIQNDKQSLKNSSIRLVNEFNSYKITSTLINFSNIVSLLPDDFWV